jgi:hypothetical protein
VARGDRLAGRLAPQPAILGGGLLDDALGAGWSVLTTAAVDPELAALAGRLRARLWQVAGGRLRADDGTVVDDDGTISRWLRSSGVRTVVLRPDRVVLLSDRSDAGPGASLTSRHAAVLRRVGA